MQTFGTRLRHLRQCRHLSQEALAAALNTSPQSISRWERNETVPQAHYRLLLSQFFGLTPLQLFDEEQHAHQEQIPSLRPIWGLPARRNPYFTGRDDLLDGLHRALSQQTPLPQALIGLGGIGKTQTALEYAYRYQHHYQIVLWLRAESRDILLADVQAAAGLLAFPERRETDVAQVMEAFTHWLRTHSGWLLIIDNVEQFPLLSEVLLPGVEACGHVLLTTRLSATGTFACRHRLDPLSTEEGALLLLRRAKALTGDRPLEGASLDLRTVALQLSQELAGLPLALDQVGAYLEETGCSIEEYVQRYRHQRKLMLSRRGNDDVSHPLSVTATISLSFLRLADRTPEAGDLMRLCAFLHPDAIPLALLVRGATNAGSVLGPVLADPLALDQVIEATLCSSLLQRSADLQTLSLHRLVQMVLQDLLEPSEQRDWARRVVLLLNQYCSKGQESILRANFFTFLPQLMHALTLLETYHLPFGLAQDLLWRLGSLLCSSRQFTQAEALLEVMRRQFLQECNPPHLDREGYLHLCGHLALAKGKYRRAEEFFDQVITSYDHAGSLDSLAASEALYHLAYARYQLGKREDIEALIRHALLIREHQLRPDHPDVATCLVLLGRILMETGALQDAHDCYQRALHIYEQQNDPYQATALANIAILLGMQGHYEQAEPLFLRVLTLHQQFWGAEHPHVANAYQNLTTLYTRQQRYQEAQRSGEQALTICEARLGPEHPQTADALWKLADLARLQAQYAVAAALLQRALTIYEQQLENGHEKVQRLLKEYESVLRHMHCDQEAEILRKRQVLPR